MEKYVDIPIELYKSSKGQYFIGYADSLVFGQGTGAWARLYNPKGSKVILHVNVWTVTDVSDSSFRAQFWFNADAPGKPTDSLLVTATNVSLNPVPKPKVKLQYAVSVDGEPKNGIKAFVRRAEPETTLVETENGKIILGEGQNFLIFLSNPENPDVSTSGRVAFGWWEDKK